MHYEFTCVSSSHSKLLLQTTEEILPEEIQPGEIQLEEIQPGEIQPDENHGRTDQTVFFTEESGTSRPLPPMDLPPSYTEVMSCLKNYPVTAEFRALVGES